MASQYAGQAVVKAIYVLDDKGKRKKFNGKDNIFQLVSNFIIEESIDFPAIRGEIAIFDTGNFISNLTGTEVFEIECASVGGGSYTYRLACYGITSRLRQEKKEAYVIKLVSPEFIQNEYTNIFGSFTGKASALADKFYKELKSNKKLTLDETDIDIKVVIPNWRPYDAISFLSTKSIRKASGSGKIKQSGYIFYENQKGFHYKGIDKIIEDINKSKPKKYVYAPKNIGQSSQGGEANKIISIQYPDLFQLLPIMRNGIWSGYAMGFDPTNLYESKTTSGSGNMVGAINYSMMDYYKAMTKLDKYPFWNENDQFVKGLMQGAKRIKYITTPSSLYGTQKGKETSKNAAKNGEKLDENFVQAQLDVSMYAQLRRHALTSIKLNITVPGAFDVTCGEGVEVTIPKPAATAEGRIEVDTKFSGKYVVIGIKHTYSVSDIVTVLELARDSVGEKAYG